VAERSQRLPASASVVIVGAGFAGAATAWALARRGGTDGLVLEKEEVPGFHASGRNAGILRQVESDPVLRRLALQGVALIARLDGGRGELWRRTGAVYVGGEASSARFAGLARALREEGAEAEVLTRDAALSRWPALGACRFATALLAPGDGVADVHALLTRFLAAAQPSFAVRTSCPVLDLRPAGHAGLVVVTTAGEIRAPLVIDASGAWAGRLGRPHEPLALQPLRRHLLVSEEDGGFAADHPVVWDLDAGYYLRREGEGLLLSPCDESPQAPGEAVPSPEAASWLAEKLALQAPRLGDLGIRRSWACLRTFAPDRRPFIGWDPQLAGLFHVSGLGGFGVSTSAAVGELAAALAAGEAGDPLLAAAFSPSRPVRLASS